METELRNHFSILMTDDQVYITNYEGLSFTVPQKFASHASLVGNEWVSYQLLKLSHHFSFEELNQIAELLRQSDSLINWQATLILITTMHSRRKKQMHKIAS